MTDDTGRLARMEDWITEMAGDIGEIKGSIKSIDRQMTAITEQQAAHGKRIRKIENMFIPAVAFMTLIGNKILKWFGF